MVCSVNKLTHDHERASDKICIKYAALPPSLPDLHESTHFPAMCFESERNPRCSSPSVKNIADIASCSYRAYKLCRRGCRFLKREYTSYMNSRRKREDGLRMHIHMKPCTQANATDENATDANATEANTTEANTTDAPRPSADEKRKSIPVNIIEYSFPAPSEQGIDKETLKHIKGVMTKKPNTTTPDGEESNTTTGDDKNPKPPTWKRENLGILEEALCAHPPSTITRLNATLPDDLRKLKMRFDHAPATRCVV
ncbi:uncharacterized protein TrAtP1_005843 [Trichoderma atroviride]|uniref:uncharacterized protein n=1 Tax=Hypocrea atroviridis TaxID=63577 RepID=UPI00332F7548|nr:hypothetical protein TrAtP1_005843 [Trichoderma atroviride]